jgi:hypothetical protein
MEFRDFLEAMPGQKATTAGKSWGYPRPYRSGPRLAGEPATIFGKKIPGGLPPWANPFKHAASGLFSALQSDLLGVIHPQGTPMMPDLDWGLGKLMSLDQDQRGLDFQITITKEEFQQSGEKNVYLAAAKKAQREVTAGLQKLKIEISSKKKTVGQEEDEELQQLNSLYQQLLNLDWKNQEADITKQTENAYELVVNVPFKNTGI